MPKAAKVGQTWPEAAQKRPKAAKRDQMRANVGENGQKWTKVFQSAWSGWVYGFFIGTCPIYGRLFADWGRPGGDQGNHGRPEHQMGSDHGRLPWGRGRHATSWLPSACLPRRLPTPGAPCGCPAAQSLGHSPFKHVILLVARIHGTARGSGFVSMAFQTASPGLPGTQEEGWSWERSSPDHILGECPVYDVGGIVVLWPPSPRPAFSCVLVPGTA